MASKYKLCSFKTCPWVHRAAIVLQEKEVPYDIEYIDRDNRPDWFLRISPHSKVPVLILDGERALFESNAIAEYLDETTEPRLHPADPYRRAQNRAWTDYVPTFGSVTHLTDAADEADLRDRCEKAAERFEKLDGALAQRGNDGPYFNGKEFSLVDAAYAPALYRFTLFDRVHPLGLIEKYPNLAAWRDALVKRPSVINSIVPDFEEYWRDMHLKRGKWFSRFLRAAAAE